MANLLKNLEVSCVSLVDRAAVRDPSNPTQPQRLLLWKRDDQGGNMPDPTPAELQAALTKAEEERDALKKAADEHAAELKKATDASAELTSKVTELEKAAKPAPAEPVVDLSKADPAIRAMLEKSEADAKAMADRLEKAEKQGEEDRQLAKAERETRLTREFVAKAEEFKALPVEAEKFGPVLKSAAEKLSKDEADELDRVLKAADEQIRQSRLFKEQGRGERPGDGGDGSAIAEVQRKAEALKKADPKLSSAQALDKAMTSDRELQERYLAEMRG